MFLSDEDKLFLTTVGDNNTLAAAASAAAAAAAADNHHSSFRIALHHVALSHSPVGISSRSQEQRGSSQYSSETLFVHFRRLHNRIMLSEPLSRPETGQVAMIERDGVAHCQTATFPRHQQFEGSSHITIPHSLPRKLVTNDGRRIAWGEAM